MDFLENEQGQNQDGDPKDYDFRQYGEMPENSAPKDDAEQNPFGDESPAFRIVTDLSKPKTMAFSVASLVLGILSVICCCGVYTGAILGILAIIFAIVSRKHLGYFDGLSVAGLVTGIFGLIFGVTLVVVSNVMDWEKILEELFGDVPDDPFPDVGSM